MIISFPFFFNYISLRQLHGAVSNAIGKGTVLGGPNSFMKSFSRFHSVN